MAAHDATQTYRPTQRVPYRIVNAVVSFLDRFRSQAAFVATPEEVLRIASKRAGVFDFNCEEFGEPLQMFCSVTANPLLTPIGRIGTKQDIISRVVNRLYIEKALRADPQLVNEPVEQPWFIMGLARSGTTLLQRLLAQDVKHRSLLSWEGLFPFPRNPRDTTHRRIGAAKLFVGATYYMAPDLRAKHELGAELPEECRLLMASSLLGSSLWGASEAFNDWYYNADKTRAFELHKIQLQYLQRNSPKRRWVLKDPEHLQNLEFLLKVYPDARIIKLHRNPIEVLPSLASLVATLKGMFLREIDKHEVGRDAVETAKLTCHSRFNTLEGSEDLAARGVPVIDVHYSDLMANPISTLAGIYHRFGCELNDEAKLSMQHYLDHNPQKKHGAHRYTLEEFSLDAAAIRSEFSSYVARYVDKPKPT